MRMKIFNTLGARSVKETRVYFVQIKMHTGIKIRETKDQNTRSS